MKTRLIRTILYLFSLITTFISLTSTSGNSQNKPGQLTDPNIFETGISWPTGQALPQFARPIDTLDGLDMRKASLSSSEKAIFSTLQGLVNKNKPRIILFDEEREGKYKWPNNLNLTINEWADAWGLLRKYQHEISGIILYDREKSIHYLNLASTIGGIKNALPVTPADWDKLKTNGLNFPVLADLTNLTSTAPADIYQYLYNNYWHQCTKRLLVSSNPRHSGYIRDIGVASGCAFVWLDPRKNEEADVLRNFLGDMKAGESIIIGWWAEERSGIGIGTSFGISTIPSDFYENTSRRSSPALSPLIWT